MANNRLFLCAVDDNGVIVDEMTLCKNFGGQWGTVHYLLDNPFDFIEKVNDFMRDAFCFGNGLAIRDEYMDVPLPSIYTYNDEYEGKGKWVFIKEVDDERRDFN